MVTIFNYTDFREYLKDWFIAKKRESRTFSYQTLAQKAGFNNKGFVYNIIMGKKLLSRANTLKLSLAMNHTKSEFDYFENLVAFGQTKDYQQRKYYFDKMCLMKIPASAVTAAVKMNRNQYGFYSTWYHSAVRSLIGMYGFRGDYAWLAKMVCPAISIEKARNSVQLLKDLGLIEQKGDGSYTVAFKRITTGKDVAGFALHSFHIDCTDLAKQALLNLPQDERNFTGLTLGMSRWAYNKVCEEILQFQERVMAIADSDDSANRVYQLNFHLFPLSKTDGK